MSKLGNPFLIIAVLVLLVIASTALCDAHSSASNNIPSSVLLTNGSSVVSGDSVINTQNIQKVPLTLNVENLLRPIKNQDVLTLFTSIITGAAPKDVVGNEAYINKDGSVSESLDGPGVIVVDDNGKVSVEQSNQMVWGYKLPYIYAVKDGDNVVLMKYDNSTIGTVASSDISGDTIPNDYIGTKAFTAWFESASDGSKTVVDYYLGAFNDNRTSVYGSDNITHLFGEDAYGYMRNYTSGSAVMVYEHNATETNISSGYSVVDYLAGYPTQIRAANAKEFANGWNNTIIPPHSMGHGKENISFTSIVEKEAASGTATHGVCPPARSLRQAVLSLGYRLPLGMVAYDRDAVLYGFAPTTGVGVYNDGDYPIKIVMWTKGDSGDTSIYTTIYQLKDNATYTNTTNSTSE